jgi:elongation factor 2 kinase
MLCAAAGDEYNKTSPPKKVDVMQAAVLEFRDRPDKPLFCVEHMIEGDYVSENTSQSLSAHASRRQPPALLSHACSTDRLYEPAQSTICLWGA